MILPIKTLKDKNGNPFVPVTSPNSIIYSDGKTLEQYIQDALDATQDAENVDVQLNGTILTVTNRNGQSTSVNTKGEQGATGAQGEKGDKGDKGDAGTTDYNDLINKPTIPSKTSDLTNDSKFVSANSQTFTDAEKEQARQNIGAAGTGDVPTLPDNVSYFSNDSGDGIVPMDGIRGQEVAASATININPEVVTFITGEIGSNTSIILTVPNDALWHVWDVFLTTAANGGATIVVPTGATLHVPSGYSIASGKTYEIRVIGKGLNYYLAYGEFA